MAETRLYELLARIRSDRSVALAVRDLTTVNGRDFEGDPRPITAGDADAVAFVGLFNAAAVADLEAARAEHAAAASIAADAIKALELAVTQRDETIRQKDGTIATLEGTIGDKDGTIAALEETIGARDSRIAELLDEIDKLKNPPANPRIFEPRTFANQLLGQHVMLAAWQSDIPEVGYATLQLLLAKYVDLDDPETTALLGILAAAGIISEDRVAEILATG